MKSSFLASLSSIALISHGTAEVLNRYTQVSTILLTGISEASAVTYSRDTDSLFAIGDEGEAIFEYTKAGALKGSMTISNQNDSNGKKALVDPEGLAYLGNGLLMIGDERPMTGLLTTYAAGTQIVARDLSVHLFDAVYAGNANVGLEGVCYDPINNSVWGVKEHGPFAIYQMTDVGGPGQNVSKPFNAREFNRLGYLTDIADIYMMANSPFFGINDPRRMNLLILSQQDNLILEMTRTGQVVDQLDISFIGYQTIEGITMDEAGVMYLVSEQGPGESGSRLHILTPPLLISTFANWAASKDLTGDNALPNSDPDLDERNNKSEYAFGGEPDKIDSPNNPSDLEVSATGKEWSYSRRMDDPKLIYIHKRSIDLVTWLDFTPETVIQTPMSEVPGFVRVTIPLNNIEDREFFQAEAIITP